MNLKEARKLKVGAIVREAWCPESKTQGIVLAKAHVKERHRAKVLCQDKSERYDITVHWLGPDRVVPYETNPNSVRNGNPRVQVRQNWEIMVISHAPLDS